MLSELRQRFALIQMFGSVWLCYWLLKTILRDASAVYIFFQRQLSVRPNSMTHNSNRMLWRDPSRGSIMQSDIQVARQQGREAEMLRGTKGETMTEAATSCKAPPSLVRELVDEEQGSTVRYTIIMCYISDFDGRIAIHYQWPCDMTQFFHCWYHYGRDTPSGQSSKCSSCDTFLIQ